MEAHMLIDLKEGKGEKSRSKYVTLGEKNACYVLITCSEPSEDGKIEVEMTYEGDSVLAAYLIESAQGRFQTEL